MGVLRWGQRLSPKALQALGIDKKRKKTPCHATYHYVFQSISAADLSKVLGSLVQIWATLLSHLLESARERRWRIPMNDVQRTASRLDEPSSERAEVAAEFAHDLGKIAPA